jgi:hypothetical protein
MAGKWLEMLAQITPPAARAEENYRTRKRTAEAQGSMLLNLRATTSLATLWRDQGKVRKARELLAPVYGWFTEGSTGAI